MCYRVELLPWPRHLRCMVTFEIDRTSTHDEDVRAFSPPSGAGESLSCQFLVAGGGLSGLSAAEAAMRRGLDVIVIEKGPSHSLFFSVQV